MATIDEIRALMDERMKVLENKFSIETEKITQQCNAITQECSLNRDQLSAQIGQAREEIIAETKEEIKAVCDSVSAVRDEVSVVKAEVDRLKRDVQEYRSEIGQEVKAQLELVSVDFRADINRIEEQQAKELAEIRAEIGKETQTRIQNQDKERDEINKIIKEEIQVTETKMRSEREEMHHELKEQMEAGNATIVQSGNELKEKVGVLAEKGKLVENRVDNQSMQVAELKNDLGTHAGIILNLQREMSQLRLGEDRSFLNIKSSPKEIYGLEPDPRGDVKGRLLPEETLADQSSINSNPELGARMMNGQISTPIINIIRTGDDRPNKFTGNGNENPKVFLRELEDYFNETRVAPDKRLKAVEKLLGGSCRNWYLAFKYCFGSYEDFRTAFLKKYWSLEVQQAIRISLYSQRYSAHQQSRYVEYFIDKLQQLKELDNAPTETELIVTIINQLPVEVQRMMVAAQVKTLVEAEQLLRQLDQTNVQACHRNVRMAEQQINAIDTASGGQKNTGRDQSTSTYTDKFNRYQPRREVYQYGGNRRGSWNRYRSRPGGDPNRRRDYRTENYRRGPYPPRRYEPRADRSRERPPRESDVSSREELEQRYRESERFLNELEEERKNRDKWKETIRNSNPDRELGAESLLRQQERQSGRSEGLNVQAREFELPPAKKKIKSGIRGDSLPAEINPRGEGMLGYRRNQVLDDHI